VNAPLEERCSAERIFFNLEAAWWFYEDYYRENDPTLPQFTLKSFAAKGAFGC
jgi:mRNA-decapping enzyme subunit 2